MTNGSANEPAYTGLVYVDDSVTREPAEQGLAASGGPSPRYATSLSSSPTVAIDSGVEYVGLLNVNPVKPASMYGRRTSAACSGLPPRTIARRSAGSMSIIALTAASVAPTR